MNFLMWLQATEIANSVGGALMWPVAIIVTVAVLLFIFFNLSKRYTKVSPEKALVLAGKGGTKVVTGGAVLVWPIIYDSYYLDLTSFEFPVDLKGVQDSKRVEISLKAIVVCRIPNNDEMIKIAAATFGRKSQKEILQLTHSAFEGHVRAAIGKMTVQQIISEREMLSQTIKHEAEPELAKLGIALVTLNIQEMTDNAGYIKALGAQETARVLADAKITAATEDRRAVIATTDAQREAEETKSQNMAKIELAKRDLETQKAQFGAEVNREKAKADQAAPLAEAEARKAVVRAEVAVKQEQTEAEIKLQESIGRKTEAELAATVLKKADAEKMRLQTEAEGRKSAALIDADAAKQRQVVEAEGAAAARLATAEADRKAFELEGQGQAAKTLVVGNADADVAAKTGKANAEAKQALMLAEAAGKVALADANKAELLAVAAGQTAQAEALKAELLAQAAGQEATLMAQAKGMQELIASYEGLTPEQIEMIRTKWIIEALPDLISKLGDAGQQIMHEIAESVTASVGKIGNVTVYDSGGANGNALQRAVKVAPDMLLDMVNSLKATGTTEVLSGLAKKFGIDLSGGDVLDIGKIDKN